MTLMFVIYNSLWNGAFYQNLLLKVLEDGKAMFDEPYVLLQNTDCSLLKMVEESGSVTATKLKEIAKDAWERKHGEQSVSDLNDIRADIENTNVIYSRGKTEGSVSDGIEEVDEKTKLLK